MGHRIGIAGASGYAGGELVRLVDGHPSLELGYLGARASAGRRLGEVHPHLRGGDRELRPLDVGAMADLDLVFLALPPGASADLAVELLGLGVRVVDLGSDFRLDTAERYAEAYGAAHPYPDQLGLWPYGIPELYREDIVDAHRVAVPGCYPTSVALAIGPLLGAGAIEPDGIVVVSMSGVSGAGRGLRSDLLYGAIDEGVRAYGVLTHRHRPEMERALEGLAARQVEVLFTPHLVPMQRGILSTCHARWTGRLDPGKVLAEAYAGAEFVEVGDIPPQTRWVVGSNRCLLSVHLDHRTRKVVVLAALDNLLKGAAGQAVQCANLMLGLPEAGGLPLEGWMP